MTRRKQHCPKRMKWEGGEGEEPPAGYQEDDGGCPEDDEDEEEEEEEGVSGGSSGSPPRSPIPSSTDVEQDAVANERLPLRETNSPSKMSRGSPRSESSLPPYEVPLLATVSPGRSPPSSDVLDFSTKRPASPPAPSQPAAMNLSSSNDDSPIDLTIRSKKIKLDPSPVSPSTDAYNRMSRPWAQYTTPVIRPISRGEMMTPPSDPVHMWNGKHGKMTYGSFPSAASDATKALEKMCELSKLQDEPRSVLAPSSGRHSAWQSHWLNKGADQTKDVLKCVWCKMSFPTLQAMSTHMAETKHGAASAQSIQPPPPPPPPPVSTSSGHKNDLNMLIKETMPLPRKLVRGQDVWLGKGAEQTRQILKCMWCGQSFRSLQEMTTHMQQTQHYTNIISQEQIISWKSADENKSSSGASSNASAASTSSPAGSVNTSANHVSAVLTCKVCDQAFNSLKELSVHMVKNAHYKEHMMRSITEGSNRRRQTREKRKKSLPVRKLLELERAQHDVKNGDGGYPTAGGGFKAVNDTNHRLGRIICEKCGEKVDVASFMEHLRVCVTMTADQKNLLKTALMSQNSMSGAMVEPGREKRPKKEQDRSHAAADLSMNKPSAAAATTGSSPSVLNAIEKLIEKSFDSRLRYGTSATGASIGESILKRLGIDESVDATKPIMDVQAMSLLRNFVLFLTMEECVGFKVLPVKVNENSKAIRQLFLKMHITREKCAQKPEYQTLFVVGVPEFCDQKIMKHAFRRCGKVKSVFFHNEPTPIEPEILPSKYFIPKSIKGFKVAYVVFAHTSGLENALSMKCTESEPFVLSTQSAPITNIVNRWCENYNENIVDEKELQLEIDTYMSKYDKTSAAQMQTEKETVDNEDEDGWKTVTKKGRNPGFARKEVIKNNIMKNEAKKKIKKTLKNFYRFQIKETKINQLMELRNKFDNDKSKIELLKQSRKFKPF